MYNLLYRILKILKFIESIIIINKDLRHKIKEETTLKIVPIIYKYFKKSIEKKYADYWIFVPFWPWGDFIICCSLLDQFRKEHGGKILLFYANNEQLKFIKSLKIADKIIKIPSEIYFRLNHKSEYIVHEGQLTKGKIFEMSHMTYKVGKDQKTNNFVELYKNMLDIKDVNFQQLQLPQNLQSELKLKLSKIAQNRKVIMITPESRSYDQNEINFHYWKKLGLKLESCGYKVIFNTKNIKYADFTCLYLPLLEQVYISTLCYANISIRSGFTDLITIMGANKQIVFYPESMRFITISEEEQNKEMSRIFNINKNLSFQQNMFNWTSINNMYKKNYLEIVLKYENIYNKLLDKLDSYDNAEREEIDNDNNFAQQYASREPKTYFANY